jgi:hypothetical protein
LSNLEWVFVRVLAFLAAFVMLFSVAAQAEEVQPQFHRNIAVKMLGYEPDRGVPEQCDKASSVASLLRVALLRKEPETRVKLHLLVAGLIGEARSVCDPPKVPPEFLEPFVKEGEKLSEAVCKAAGDELVGKINDQINSRIVTDHPDSIAGYIYGIARAVPPIAKACYEHTNAWARLETQSQLLESRARIQRELRGCTLWRRAYYDELKKASKITDEQGRAAGLQYLSGKPLVALTGSRSYCTDDLGKAFEMSNYDLTRTMINASPETPAQKK